MKTFTIVDKYIIAVGSKDAKAKFLVPLSHLIKEEFGHGPYDEVIVTKIVSFCLDYYAEKFETICQGESSYTFYKMVFWFNEQATEMRHDKNAMANLPAEIDIQYFWLYRRILKMILEQGCTVKMVTGEEINEIFRERFQLVFDELLFLGESLFNCAENDAEQKMIGDAIKISFNDRGLFYFSRKYHFEDAFRHIVATNIYDESKFVIDKNAENDFITACKDSFDVDYRNVAELIGHIGFTQELKAGDAFTIARDDLSSGMNQLFHVPIKKAEDFFSGLYFTEKHRHPVKELVTKPYSINRFLYRPILVWNIDKKKYCVLGIFSFDEAMNTLYLDAFPWGKASEEWKINPVFKNFIDRKSDVHDKWLDDAVEKEIQTTQLIYDRDIKTIKAKKGYIKIDNSNCGQLDFLCLNKESKKIFIVECKHLIGRYDMANQKLDYYKFTSDDKSFNETIESKINWIKNNINSVEEHFQFLANESNLSINDFKVEGIFFINTPTFYMYNSGIRIYTYHEVAKVLTGKHVDKTYTLYTVDEDYESTIWIRHPYFTKKQMYFYNDPDDDCEVDKYGVPIKS